MKQWPGVLLFALCVSCTTTNLPHSESVKLPQLTVERVDFTNGINEREAVLLAWAYFHRYVGNCGMPDAPQNAGLYWRVQLWGGFAGADYGTLWLAKDGSEVLLEPPHGGFKKSTQALLKAP